MAKTKLTEYEHAEKVLNELQAKRDAVTASSQNDEAEMGDVAYAAHTGDQKAAAKLETLRERALRRDLEVRNLDSAIEEAKRRVAAAQEAECRAEERRVALEVRSLIGSLRDAGKVCDEALQTFAAASDAMREIVAKINALGFNHPTAMQLQSLGERAVRTMLVQSAFARAFEHIAPRERQNFNHFTSRWCVSLEREIAQRLGEHKQKEDAA
jgi:hypothetical protein